MSFFISSWVAIYRTVNRWSLHTTSLTRLMLSSVLLVEGLSHQESSFIFSSCYIIAEGFFLYYPFVGYILSFGLVRLRTFRLSARVGAHIERRCSCLPGEDVIITDVIIKTPDRKCDWGMWMTSCPEAMGWDSWVFWKKQSWDLNLDGASWFSELGEAGPVGVYEMHRGLLGQMEQSA